MEESREPPQLEGHGSLNWLRALTPLPAMATENGTSASDSTLELMGFYASTCGYCGGQPGTRSSSHSSHSFGAEPDDLLCSVR